MLFSQSFFVALLERLKRQLARARPRAPSTQPLVPRGPRGPSSFHVGPGRMWWAWRPGLQGLLSRWACVCGPGPRCGACAPCISIKVEMLPCQYVLIRCCGFLVKYTLSFWPFVSGVTSCLRCCVSSTTFICSVQSLSRVRLSATPWTAACQAFLSVTNSWRLLKLLSILLVMPSSHLILCCPLLLLPSVSPSMFILRTYLLFQEFLSVAASFLSADGPRDSLYQ